MGRGVCRCGRGRGRRRCASGLGLWGSSGGFGLGRDLGGFGLVELIGSHLDLDEALDSGRGGFCLLVGLNGWFGGFGCLVWTSW